MKKKRMRGKVDQMIDHCFYIFHIIIVVLIYYCLTFILLTYMHDRLSLLVFVLSLLYV